ncbi:MAG: DUF86 domain-containing protein [Candidatus Bipolaricaulota bacterium]|nr:DUF86 domain-containing protein [Candidatus Bipolaricaulota bacterium]MDW8152433.1 DUF86 domain-containing protein [Candidatus Bipolaricaulota bacterium]
MVRPEVLRRRLEKLQEYLRILEGLAQVTEAEFLADPRIHGSAERFLQLAIEALLDLGAHVVAEMELGQVETYRDIPRTLEKAGYVPAELARRWEKIVGFRNILVHEYVDLDRRLVYTMLREGLEDLRRLQAIFGRFL